MQPGLVTGSTTHTFFAGRTLARIFAQLRAPSTGQIARAPSRSSAARRARPSAFAAPSPRHRARVRSTRSSVRPSGRPRRPFGALFVVEVRAGRAYRHQVRAHLAAVGAPIVGDALYGGVFGARHYLHAARLSFRHPHGGHALDLRAELPGDWPEAL